MFQSPTPSPGTEHSDWNPWVMVSVAMVCIITLFFSCFRILQRQCTPSVQRRRLDDNPEASPSLRCESRGLDSYIMHSIPITQFEKNKDEESCPGNTDCAVCLGEFEEGQWSGGGGAWYMAELLRKWKENKLFKVVFAVAGIMSTLVVYGVLQEKIMRVPYGPRKEYFKYSLFLVFCNRITTSAVSAGVLLASGKALDAVAPLYKYGIISVSNILTTTCQYEALKYVSFPVQTLAKCAKMIPVMIWGTVIMQKKYNGRDYLLAFLVTLGCSLFILYPAAGDISPHSRGRESTVWGVSLMLGYLGFDGFTSTFQDKLFRGYDMEIQNQIFYTTLCSCILSFTGLILQGNLLTAIDFVSRHNDCFVDISILSTVATISQFFISYTIRNFGALTFATIMTTRQLVSILLSCVWFGHPLSVQQCVGSVIVFGSLYAKSFLRSKPRQLPSEHAENRASSPLRANA
ncbi:UDP-galactose UDP-glucose transporter 5B-like [Olea europaea subsp. europaea]|uniref:UDP-galactose UDP-glucose transporter 5B-like n=2 Tax=Olea europaea subsp. europaea TaxID=158383 RepID=A0A8S0S8F7_OLEEU|nr:UDP-galactose UDP-glucose transporter 5B-like [Olea europaea subsp. europaea]